MGNPRVGLASHPEGPQTTCLVKQAFFWIYSYGKELLCICSDLVFGSGSRKETMCLQCVRLIKTNLAGNTTVLKLAGNINQPVYTEQSIQIVLDKLPKCPAMKALEDLTPSGSEFYEEPKVCYTFVRLRLDNQWKMLKEKIIELNGLKLHKDDNLELIGRTCKHCGKQFNGTAFGMCSQCGRFQ